MTVEDAGDRAFSAGADIPEFVDARGADALDQTGMFEKMADFPRPVIATID